MKILGKPLEVRHQLIDSESDGQRIDNYLLRELKGAPKSLIYRILRSGEVRVNGGRAAPTRRLAAGDTVRIPPLRLSEASAPAIPHGTAFSVVFEDDALLVINKPAGTAVHGGSGLSYGVIEQLRKQRPTARLLELVHRLDRETSGLLLIAKKRSVLTKMHDQMRGGEVVKKYLTLVSGRWRNELQHLRQPLLKYLTSEGERRVRVDSSGKPAHSIVRLVQRFTDFSLLEVELKTGRTHQIRVHLAQQGFRLCGDDKYGDFEQRRQLQKQGLKRMFLHAFYLQFAHPVTGEIITLETPLAEELQRFINTLQQEVQP